MMLCLDAFFFTVKDKTILLLKKFWKVYIWNLLIIIFHCAIF